MKLMGVNIRNAMVGIVGIFKDPMDEKLVAMVSVTGMIPRQVITPKITLVPDLVISPEPASVSEPDLVPEPPSVPELTLVHGCGTALALESSDATVSKVVAAPKLCVVPERGMEAALRLSNEMVARINAINARRKS